MKKTSFIKRNQIFVLFLLFFISFWGCQNQNKKYDKIDSLLKYCYENGQFNGNVLVAEKGIVIYNRAFGISNFDPIDSLKINSQFRLGSVTKQFTAMAIMMLKEQGKLDLDDNIRKYLPELSYNGITIRHLLTHTSGLPDYMTLFDQHWHVDKKADVEKQIADNDDVIRLFAKYNLDVLFQPGEKMVYSNTGYVLLASIVARASGLAFEKFLNSNIFKPLKMDRSLVYSAIRDDSMEDRVYGFRFALNGSDYLPNDYHYLNGIAGDGAVYSTTNDLFKWDRALYTEKLVSNKMLQQAFSPVILNNDSTVNYGFGWRIDSTLTGKKCVQHSGGWVGFITWISREIEENNTIIVLTNHSSSYVNGIRKAIDQILHDRPFSFPKINISDEVGKKLINQGSDAAIAYYYDLKKNKSDLYNFHERLLNALGYQLIDQDKLAEAIEIFKLNSDNFPESSNGYDSLAEAYMLSGNSELAIKNYKKSLELDPDNKNAAEKLKQLTKNLRE